MRTKQNIIQLRGKIFFKIVLIFFGVLFYGCKNNKLQNHLKNIKEEYKFISTDNWQVYRSIINDKEEFYNLKKINDDTTYYLNFIVTENKDYFIESYEVLYKFRDSLYMMELNATQDTLCFYKHPMTKELGCLEFKKMSFIKGKYYYMFKTDKLNPSQRKFFEAHSDSLTKIKGNNLPILPD